MSSVGRTPDGTGRGHGPARARGDARTRGRDDATRMTMWRAVSMSTLRRVVPSMTAVRERNHRVVGVAARRAFERRGRTFATGGEGNNITSALMEQMREKISEGLEAQSVDVNDLSGNGRHVSIKVVSQAFEGKSSVNRQRMVYKCIWMELQDQVHAVNEMVTMTPDEATKM
jgi:stress-induced morphogen